MSTFIPQSPQWTLPFQPFRSSGSYLLCLRNSPSLDIYIICDLTSTWSRFRAIQTVHHWLEVMQWSWKGCALPKMTLVDLGPFTSCAKCQCWLLINILAFVEWVLTCELKNRRVLVVCTTEVEVNIFVCLRLDLHVLDTSLLDRFWKRRCDYESFSYECKHMPARMHACEPERNKKWWTST